MKIGFIGFGEAARAFRTSLAEADPALVFAAYDILLDSEGSQGSCAAVMKECDVAAVTSYADGFSDCDWIVSAVTADQSLEAARAASAWLRPGQTFFDINSVSPQRKQESAAHVSATGSAYLDMAVMAPVHPRGHRTPVLLAGNVEPSTRQALADFGFDFEVVGPQAGAATAIKMVRSLFVKGLEAITVEALLAAQASGCLDYVLKSLGSSFPGLGWPDFAHYQFERTLTHGNRRAAEMRESAATMATLGCNDRLADAIADTQARMASMKAAPHSNADLAAVLAALEPKSAR
jgi:3-hydroxyisobutyrate dehydrogenase-like beta-hydroxyacid dehydrogenase